MYSNVFLQSKFDFLKVIIFDKAFKPIWTTRDLEFDSSLPQIISTTAEWCGVVVSMSRSLSVCLCCHLYLCLKEQAHIT